jgi:DNA-directed RNA polymerase subunit RPC12/RpoP
MSLEPPDKGGAKQWESVHKCSKCGQIVNLAEIDLRAIATGIIACPKCDWSGQVEIKIIEQNPTGEGQ